MSLLDQLINSFLQLFGVCLTLHIHLLQLCYPALSREFLHHYPLLWGLLLLLPSPSLLGVPPSQLTVPLLKRCAILAWFGGFIRVTLCWFYALPPLTALKERWKEDIRIGGNSLLGGWFTKRRILTRWWWDDDQLRRGLKDIRRRGGRFRYLWLHLFKRIFLFWLKIEGETVIHALLTLLYLPRDQTRSIPVINWLLWWIAGLIIHSLHLPQRKMVPIF